MRKALFLLLAVIALASCKTAEQLANDKAAKAERERREQAAKVEQARQQRLKDLADMRRAYPCDTPSIKEDTVYLQGRRDTVSTPGQTDTMRITRTVTVRDQSGIKSLQDSLDAARYQIDLRDQHIEDSRKDYRTLQAAHAKAVERADKEEAKAKMWKRRCLVGGGIISGVIVLWLALAGKLSWVGSLLKLFRK